MKISNLISVLKLWVVVVGSVCSSWAATRTVTISNFAFTDAVSNNSTTVINAGDTVQWSWSSGTHSTTSGTCSGPGTCNPSGTWDSTVLSSPNTFSFTFNNDGSFPYYCRVHTTGMLGKVIVNPVVTNTNDSGPGSLRQAILDFNANLDLTSITFNIPGGGVHTITPLSALPAITKPSGLLDGTSQPGWTPSNPLIELDGASAGANANGITIRAPGTKVRGLIINRFSQFGIEVEESFNIITGNFIGTNATGTASLGNIGGVALIGFPPHNDGNTVGGTTVADRNVISGNGVGVEISQGTGNLVEGNFIGTDATGSSALANTTYGVELDGGASGNYVGNTVAGAGNVISGNTSDGVVIVGSSSNYVDGNFIGINAAGTAALGNGANGLVVGSDFVGVGGNVISGNASAGIVIGGLHNLVTGNLIGTNAAGNAKIPNGDGVLVVNLGSNTIGGASAQARNVISGNISTGVTMKSGTTGNVVSGNLIGTDISGTTALGNSVGVLVVSNATNNTIGAGNVISGNAADGVNLSAGGNNILQGNFIGTNVAGTSAIGNGGNGVSVVGGAASNTIGGVAVGARNIISGNLGHGVAISGTSSNGNVVEGNYIGTDVSVTNGIGNLGDGVRIDSGAANNSVGVAAQNLIAFNAKGVVVTGTASTGNAIEGNAIFSNTGLGIDLGDDGVTANDSSGHTGPNNFQNFPVLTSAISTGATTTVMGTLNSAPNAAFHVELFGNSGCDSSGHGQGLNLLGTSTVNTDGSGNASLSFSFSASLIGTGSSLSATATDSGNNTSELSACKQADYALTNTVGHNLHVRLGKPFTFVVASFTDTDPSGSASQFSSTSIDWGDGTTPTTATQIVSLGNQNYNVIGVHAYTKVGAWTVTVTINDSGGSSATATSKARLWPKPLSY